MPVALWSQVYSNQNNLFGLDVQVTSNLFGAGVSFHDFNGDGWDDLSFSEDNEVKFYRNNEGICEPITLPFVISNNAKHPVWVDYDNDGDEDFFITHYLGYNKLYRSEGNMTFTDVTSISGLADYLTPHFGSCWGDYDRDGDLDVYICNYIFIYEESDEYEYWDHLYQNNGDGTFSDVTIASGAYDGISLSFQSIWMDYNNDLWPDLYVINDKAHPNRLYHNNGDGTFTEVAGIAGATLAPVDAMTASCGDMNNDGFHDIFVTNTSIGPCAMLKNNGNDTFTNIANSSGTTLNVLAWGGNWFDYDLDMDQDIYVCEYYPLFPELQNKFMRNNGNETFHNVNPAVFPFDFSNSYSSAVGDWNRDGYPDLAVSNYEPQNANFWLSGGGNKHSISIALQGLVSNINGIGSWIEVYSGGISQFRYTMCGENYMGQDSQFELFGLNENELVDSIIVHWPSGHIDQFFDINSDQSLWLIEGSGIVVQPTIVDNAFLCQGESVVLDAGEYASYLWDNGETDRFREVSQGGVYAVEVVTDLGFVGSADIEIEEAFDPELNFDITDVSCFGADDGAIIYSSGVWPELWQWSNGEMTLDIDSLAMGVIVLNTTYSNGCAFEYSFEVDEPDSLYIHFDVEHILCAGDSTGEIILSESNADITSLIWQGFGETNTLTELIVGNYYYTLTDNSMCVLEGFISIVEPDSVEVSFTINDISCFGESTGSVELDITGGVEPYITDWFGMNPEQLSIGEYNVIVIDANQCAKELSFSVSEPDELIGTAEVTCIDLLLSAELDVSGGVEPYSYLWSNGSDEFYVSNVSEGLPLSVVITDFNGCEYSINEIECPIGILEDSFSKISMFPNPASNYLNVVGLKVQGYNFLLFDTFGRMVMKGLLSERENSIRLHHIEKGLLFIELYQNQTLVFRSQIVHQ